MPNDALRGRYAAVVSHHTDPERCGVARFNVGLAARLGVPVVMPIEAEANPSALWSLKWAELGEWARQSVRRGARGADILWHDGGHPDVTKNARRVWYAWDIGAPALVRSEPVPAGWMLSLGMSHKVGVDVARYTKLAQLARESGSAPSLLVSSRPHVGEMARGAEVEQRLGAILPTTYLGEVSDAGLALIWPWVLLFVAFFPDGLQANHTSIHAALDAQKPVLTNWGPRTPADLKAYTVNLDDLTAWPTGWMHEWPQPARSPYTWDRVMEALV